MNSPKSPQNKNNIPGVHFGGREAGCTRTSDASHAAGCADRRVRITAEHYYSERPAADSRPATIEYFLKHSNGEYKLDFITDNGVFSKQRVDFGTDLLIRSVPPLRGKALDLGCGYGALGISLSLLNPGLEVWFSDINERAVSLCRQNYKRLVPNHNIDDGVASPESDDRVICSDGFSRIGGVLFDVIVTNPPVRAGKAGVYKLFRDARAHINDGGALYIVIQKKQGMQSAYNELTGIYGNCADIARKAGYHVLASYNLHK